MLNSTKLTKCLIVLIGILLAAVVWTTLVGEPASAQQGIGGDRFTIAVVGFWRDNSEPVFIIDTRKQKIAVYEFDSEQDFLDLMAVRSYEYDRRLLDYVPRKHKGKGRGRGPTVRQMMQKAGVGG